MQFNTQIEIKRDDSSVIKIGAGQPVVIQTMWKDKLSPADIDIKSDAGTAFVKRIENLSQMGCGLLRFAVPDIESADVLGRAALLLDMPIVADIHFDYKIALRCLDYPIAKIRINPGNIGAKERVAAVLEKCKDKNVCVRIGVNAGSLSQDLRRRVEAGELSRTAALVESAARELAIFDEFNFYNVAVSLKASSVAQTISANRLFAAQYALPLHVGVTEAGPLVAGVVRNTAALYDLLRDGIGDTVRVSLSDSVENEVIAAREIILAAQEGGYGVWGMGYGEDVGSSVSGTTGHLTGNNKDYKAEITLNPKPQTPNPIHPSPKARPTLPGVRIISCPRCGRCGFDTHAFTARWQNELYKIKKDITIAIMGCAVNGPGEARDADLGITGSDSKTLLFKKGEIIRRLDPCEADTAFAEELDKLMCTTVKEY
jgi:(E)-4-hydroxy-3-methylbut-2-enyl-diphosphate synthase